MKYTLLPALVLAVLLNTGCVSKINDSRLNMDLGNVRQSEILKLVNSNDDITLYNMGSQIMVESGFMNQSGQEYGYYAIAIYNYVDSAPNLFILGWVNGLTLFVPSLIGFPTDLQEFGITAFLYIFDSTGTMIKVYRNSNSFTKMAGLYYGQDPHKKASRFYSGLFSEILAQANMQKDEINYLLRQAGPVTTENMQDARMKITDFFKLNRR
jgi:hypothetical protein